MQNNYGILSAIGNTPVARLRYTGFRKGAGILLKLEGTNPGGSVKDRSALWMVRHAEKEGLLYRGRTIIEATSGNTGIGLAMVGAALGYKVKLVIPDNVSAERKHILQAFGARLITTRGHLGTDGAIAVAKQVYQDNPEQYFMPDQYSNNANWLSHYESTAPEIIRQTAGTVNAFVAGIGTGGTLMGVSRRLKEFSPEIRIIGVEPEIGHSIQGLKNIRPPDLWEFEVKQKLVRIPLSAGNHFVDQP